MTTQKALEVLRQFNMWWRYDGDECPEICLLRELGEAIDTVCDALEDRNERANELTWLDVAKIVSIYEHYVEDGIISRYGSADSVRKYSEFILHRFNETINGIDNNSGI